MSPTFFRSSGNTTTVKGHALWSWQKVRKVTPLLPSSTCSTVPLTHWVVPTCLLASANETQSCLEVLLARSEEYTSELQSHLNLVCRLLLEKKKKKKYYNYI